MPHTRKTAYICPIQTADFPAPTTYMIQKPEQAVEPLVTIVLPVYNASTYLTTCLESLLSQSYGYLEIIAIDDCSRDNSFQILSKYRKRDSRIKVYRNKKHYGLAVCLNRAMKRASGQLITFMDPKDVSTMTRLEEQIFHLMSNPKTVAVGTQCLYISGENENLDESSFPTGHDQVAETIFAGHSMLFETVLINRLMIPKDLLYFKPSKYPLIYAEVFMKLATYGTVANIPQVLYYRRSIEFSLIGKTKVHHASNILKSWLKARASYAYSPSFKSLFVPLTKLL